jgi:hypothetical protein
MCVSNVPRFVVVSEMLSSHVVHDPFGVDDAIGQERQVATIYTTCADSLYHLVVHKVLCAQLLNH